MKKWADVVFADGVLNVMPSMQLFICFINKISYNFGLRGYNNKPLNIPRQTKHFINIH